MLSDSTTLLLIDPHQLFIDGLVSLLERKKEFEIIGAYTNPATGLHAYKKLQPQVTIISDCFPDMHTVTLIQEMKLFRKQAKVIVLAGKLQDFMVLESIKSGADGFIARSSGFHILEKALGKIINDESYYCDMVSQILAKSLLSGNENKSSNTYSQDNNQFQNRSQIDHPFTQIQINRTQVNRQPDHDEADKNDRP